MAAGGKKKHTARRRGLHGGAVAGGGNAFNSSTSTPFGRVAPRRGRAATAADAAANNPFERIRVHTKFDILGVKKTKTRRMRNDATERRKRTLLVEYREQQRANSFLDRRFGDAEAAGLDEEEKALLLLQRQRAREAKAAAFSLADDDDGSDEDDGYGDGSLGKRGKIQLTHGGRALGEDDYDDAPDDSEDDGLDLDASHVAAAHFGGFIPKNKGNDGDEGSPPPSERQKTKKEVMEELIAKSKAHKELKRRAREDDAAATDALDEAFASLVQGKKGLLSVRDKKDRDGGAIQETDSTYDALRRELFAATKQGKGDGRAAPAQDKPLADDELPDGGKARAAALAALAAAREPGAASKRRAAAAAAAAAAASSGGARSAEDLDDFDLDGEGDAAAAEEEAFLEAAAAAGGGGGFAARRARRELEKLRSERRERSSSRKEEDEEKADESESGESESDDSGDGDGKKDESESDDGDGAQIPKPAPGTLAARRAAAVVAARESGNPLQRSLGKAMAELMEKHGMTKEAERTKRRSGVEEEEEDGEEESDGDGEEESDGDGEEESDSDEEEEESDGDVDSEEEEEEEEEGEELKGKRVVSVEEASSSGEDDSSSSDDDDDDDAPPPPRRVASPASESDSEEEREESESGSEEESDGDERKGPTVAVAPLTPQRPKAYEDPLSYSTFAAAVGLPNHVTAATLGQRVAAYRVAAGGKLAADARRGLQALFAHLVRAFAEEASASSTSSTSSSSGDNRRKKKPDLSLLDALACEAASVASEVPYYAVAVARARLERARGRLLSRLAAAAGKSANDDDSKNVFHSPWPDARDSALVVLSCGTLFPLVDTAQPGFSGGHPASAPAALLAAAPLALCPVAERRDVGTGLMLATALQSACESVPLVSCSSPSNTAAAWAPEPVEFASEVVRRAAVAPPHDGGDGDGDDGGGVSGTAGRWRLPAGSWAVFPHEGEEKKQAARKGKKKSKEKSGDSAPRSIDLSLDAAAVLSRDASYTQRGDDDPSSFSLYPARCTAAALALLERAAVGQGGAPAAPEALGGATSAVAALIRALEKRKQEDDDDDPLSSSIRASLLSSANSAIKALRSASDQTLRTRKPLFLGGGGKKGAPAAPVAEDVQTLNPRFDEDFAPGRDADPDRERAAQRALRRSIARERRGAMRELRKDAAFVSAARDEDARKEAAERKAARKAGLAFMEQQAADARSGGQGGQWKRRKF